MDYSILTVDQQKEILRGRVAAWEADHYGHTINLMALEANGVPDADKAATRTALATLEASILDGRAELERLDAQQQA